jgi:hypothetical protein
VTAFDDCAVFFQDNTGGPKTPQMLTAIKAWAIHESGNVIRGNNPWNLHVGPPCPTTSYQSVLGLNPSQTLSGYTGGVVGNRYAGAGDQNVAIFDTLAHGVARCVNNLVSHGHDWTHYDAVLAAARAGTPIEFLDALAASAWSAGRYGTANGGPNVLIPLYQKLLGEIDVTPTAVKLQQWTATADHAVLRTAPDRSLNPFVQVPGGTTIVSYAEFLTDDGHSWRVTEWPVGSGTPAYFIRYGPGIPADHDWIAGPIPPPDGTPFSQADIDKAVKAATDPLNAKVTTLTASLAASDQSLKAATAKISAAKTALG